MSILTKIFNQSTVQPVEQAPIQKLPFKELVAKLKAELKVMTATHIEKKRAYGRPYDNSRDLRIKHAAYCMLRGTPFDKIETKWRDQNSWINISVKKSSEELAEKYKQQIQE